MVKSVLAASLMIICSISAAQACFLSGEQVSGMNKICFYDCVEGTRAITISSVALCPLSIAASEDDVLGGGEEGKPLKISCDEMKADFLRSQENMPFI